MARPNKAGLDYFDLDCHMEEKVRLIQAEFGLKGFAVVVKLYQKIYGGHGYYCEWNNDMLLLFMSENGLMGKNSKNLIIDIVSACIRRDIFSETLFQKFGILTSEGVQKRYLNATSRRERVEMKKEYLLISVDKNRWNVVINQVNVDGNGINTHRNSQSREEKSRVYNKNTMCKADAVALFEELWKLYPVKKGKGQVSEAKKRELLRIGHDEMDRAIRRYRDYVDSVSYLHYQNGSTFFNSGYVDYLDANYVPGGQKDGKSRAKGFAERDATQSELDELERQLLGR